MTGKGVVALLESLLECSLCIEVTTNHKVFGYDVVIRDAELNVLHSSTIRGTYENIEKQCREIADYLNEVEDGYKTNFVNLDNAVHLLRSLEDKMTFEETISLMESIRNFVKEFDKNKNEE